MTTYDTILQSMTEGRPLRLVYNGYERFMCAHTIGTSDGKERALLYQYAGETSDGPLTEPNWRCLTLSDVTEIEIIDGEWVTGFNHSKPQTCVKVVAAAVYFDSDGNPEIRAA